MHDVANLPDGTSIIKFIGGPDHRLVYNIDSNSTQYYSTEEFLSLCELEGPCYKGKFLGNNNLLYLAGGWPPIVFQRKGNKVFIVSDMTPECLFSRKNQPQHLANTGMTLILRSATHKLGIMRG